MQAVFHPAVACPRAVGARWAGELGTPLCTCRREKGVDLKKIEGQSHLIQTQQLLTLLPGTPPQGRSWGRGREQGCHSPRTLGISSQEAEQLAGPSPPLRKFFLTLVRGGIQAGPQRFLLAPTCDLARKDSGSTHLVGSNAQLCMSLRAPGLLRHRTSPRDRAHTPYLKSA